MLKQAQNQNEKGNALFLILIAVILFAALSYAITQSNRGGGAPNRETNLISSTTVTQYSSAIRTGVTRMLLRNIDSGSISFVAPTEAAFTSATSDDAKKMIFHPDGGGVSYSPVDYNTVDVVQTTMSATQNGNWRFVKAHVSGIGTTPGTPTVDNADLVAMLDNVKKAICERVNEQINGNTTVPVLASASTALFADNNQLLTGAALQGKPFLCIKASDHYVYYHVIAEQ